MAGTIHWAKHVFAGVCQVGTVAATAGNPIAALKVLTFPEVIGQSASHLVVSGVSEHSVRITRLPANQDHEEIAVTGTADWRIPSVDLAVRIANQFLTGNQEKRTEKPSIETPLAPNPIGSLRLSRIPNVNLVS